MNLQKVKASKKAIARTRGADLSSLLLLTGILTDDLKNFLEMNLPKVKAGKKAKFSLGVGEPKLGSSIFEATSVPVQSNEFVLEFIRGIRLHFQRFVKDLKVSCKRDVRETIFTSCLFGTTGSCALAVGIEGGPLRRCLGIPTVFKEMNLMRGADC
jgi:hypothetical protein